MHSIDCLQLGNYVNILELKAYMFLTNMNIKIVQDLFIRFLTPAVICFYLLVFGPKRYIRGTTETVILPVCNSYSKTKSNVIVHAIASPS